MSYKNLYELNSSEKKKKRVKLYRVGENRLGDSSGIVFEQREEMYRVLGGRVSMSGHTIGGREGR